ncbi:MAG: DNA polymerase III subunit gamma/tau [Eubacteriales bacterium]
MSYTALYRKFRPSNFEDVRGQDHIVTTLTNQIEAQRVGHAYLFCGTRGTGKTSIAKIFAKTVNCENRQNGQPCETCNSCKTISGNVSIDVVEMDAASNNGVDHIREIVERVSYTPAQSKYKVYIIDEVHMLTTGAFNALLKTLEEPPSYVIFILATTEANKIPITILSRCQRYDFKRITQDVIFKRMQELVDVEQLVVEERALHYIARLGDGSMRDALSLLEKCLAFHYGEELTYDHVLDVFGAVDTKVFDEFFKIIVEGSIIDGIELIEEITMQGREYVQFINEFTWYLRNVLLIKMVEDKSQLDTLEDIVERSTDRIKEVYKVVEPINIEEIYRYIRIFTELSNQMKYATQKRILLETTMIKMCRPIMENDYESLVARIRQLEEKMEKGIVVSSLEQGMSEREVREGNDDMSKMHPSNTKEGVVELLDALPEEIRQIAASWTRIVMNMSSPMKQYLRNANISVSEEDTLLIVLEEGMEADYFLQNEEHKQQLQDIINNEIQREVDIEIRKRRSNQLFQQEYPDLEQIIKMKIDIVD